MKRQKKITIIFVLLSVLSVVLCLRQGWQGLRMNKIDANSRSLSRWIEIYRGYNGQYPKALSDMLTNGNEDQTDRNAINDLLKELEHNPWHDRYDYQPSTNGFTIIVTGPDVAPTGWVGKEQKIEKHYSIGDAVKQWE
jgi:hypothetical protein